MIFIYYMVALISLSLTTQPVNSQTQGVELVLQNRVFQDLVFSADVSGVEKFIYQFALEKMGVHGSRAGLLSGVESLAPKFSALALIYKLIHSEDDIAQKKNALKILDDGLFRKNNIKGFVAPKATEISLRWAKSEMKKGDLADLIDERSALKAQAERELSRVIDSPGD